MTTIARPSRSATVVGWSSSTATPNARRSSLDAVKRSETTSRHATGARHRSMSLASTAGLLFACGAKASPQAGDGVRRKRAIALARLRPAANHRHSGVRVTATIDGQQSSSTASRQPPSTVGGAKQCLIFSHAAKALAHAAVSQSVDALERESDSGMSDRRRETNDDEREAMTQKAPVNKAMNTNSTNSTKTRRFTVYRRGDLSETHNANQVNPADQPQYEGVVFSDGTTVVRWLTAARSTSVWADFGTMWKVHGHDDPNSKHGTVIVWHDGAPKETP